MTARPPSSDLLFIPPSVIALRLNPMCSQTGASSLVPPGAVESDLRHAHAGTTGGRRRCQSVSRW
jgi:hypothetical protein